MRRFFAQNDAKTRQNAQPKIATNPLLIKALQEYAKTLKPTFWNYESPALTVELQARSVIEGL